MHDTLMIGSSCFSLASSLPEPSISESSCLGCLGLEVNDQNEPSNVPIELGHL